jgi:hypothetical protein
MSEETAQAGIVDPLFVVVTNGTNRVLAAYPTAVFLEADGPWNQGGTRWDWRLVYGIPATHNSRPMTVFLYSKDFQFTQPQLVQDLFLEDDPVPVPLEMGVIEANRLAVAAGYTGAIVATSARWQVTHPATPEPQIIFTIPSQGVEVKVGMRSKKVTTVPIPPPEASTPA